MLIKVSNWKAIRIGSRYLKYYFDPYEKINPKDRR